MSNALSVCPMSAMRATVFDRAECRHRASTCRFRDRLKQAFNKPPHSFSRCSAPINKASHSLSGPPPDAASPVADSLSYVCAGMEVSVEADECIAGAHIAWLLCLSPLLPAEAFFFALTAFFALTLDPFAGFCADAVTVLIAVDPCASCDAAATAAVLLPLLDAAVTGVRELDACLRVALTLSSSAPAPAPSRSLRLCLSPNPPPLLSCTAEVTRTFEAPRPARGPAEKKLLAVFSAVILAPFPSFCDSTLSRCSSAPGACVASA